MYVKSAEKKVPEIFRSRILYGTTNVTNMYSIKSPHSFYLDNEVALSSFLEESTYHYFTRKVSFVVVIKTKTFILSKKMILRELDLFRNGKTKNRATCKLKL